MRVFLILFLATFLKLQSYTHELALCAIFQNEAPYLREWIEFHKLVGVTQFYLYNNLSMDHYQEVLEPYIQSGEVKLIDWPYKPGKGSDWNSIQCKAYLHAIKKAKNVVKWLVIIDTDEFIFPVQEPSLIEFLKDYEPFAAVTANWQMYGTSGVAMILPGHLMIEDLTMKAPTLYGTNSHIKSIVRPETVKKIENPHSCVFKKGYYQVDADKKRFEGPFKTIQIDKIRINHYWTRDEHFFFTEKVARRMGQWNDKRTLERASELNEEADTAIYKYVHTLRDALGM